MKNLFEGLTEETLEKLNKMKEEYPSTASVLIYDLKSTDIVGNLRFMTLRTMLTYFTEKDTFEEGFDVYTFFKED
tara:strand:+ start:10056 stop:10280 length:225 start_codon:yes stop_codon:yes gene_type:complete